MNYLNSDMITCFYVRNKKNADVKSEGGQNNKPSVKDYGSLYFYREILELESKCEKLKET